MPLYLYRCPERHEFEKFRRMNMRNDPIYCPICGQQGWLVITPVAHKQVFGVPTHNKDPFKPLPEKKYQYPSEFRRGKLF